MEYMKLVKIIETLNEPSSSAVLNRGHWFPFRTAASRLLLPILFSVFLETACNLFLETTMQETLENFTSVQARKAFIGPSIS